MTPRPRSSLAERLLWWTLAGHAYRDAILGDLAEESARVSMELGAASAAAWYRREALRSASALARSMTIDSGVALRLLLVVPAIYATAIAATNAAALGIASFAPRTHDAAYTLLYLSAVACAGIAAGAAVARAPRAAAVPAVLSLLALALPIGAWHVLTAPSEPWFRLAKVCTFVLAIAGGALILGARSPVRRAPPEAPAPPPR